MNQISRIIYISRKHSHHSKFSGYDQLLNLSSNINRRIFASSFNKFPYRLAKLISNNLGPELYNSESLRKELAAFWLFLKRQGNHIHYLYGDRDYSLLGSLKFKNLSLSATFHLPPSLIRDRFYGSHSLHKLDLAIAVSRNQISILNDLGIKHTAFIPHGIDTKFWFPVSPEWNSTKAISVGVHMRDFNKQVLLAEKIKEKIPKFVLEIIAPKRFVSLIPDSKAIRLFSDISDEELREKYSTSCFHLMALNDCTANNALLEGLSCGLPTIITDVGGVRDYVDEDCAFLCRSDNDFLDSAFSLITNESLNKTLRKKSEIQARKFSWESVTKLLESEILKY